MNNLRALGAAFTVYDDVTPAQPWTSIFLLSGAGNACLNPDGLRRWGDYLSVRVWEPSRSAWLGSVFRLTADAGNCGSSSGVEIHNLVFGRDGDLPSYKRWKNK